MALYTRKETSLKTGIPSDTLRYYEKEGVIPAPRRSENSYRRYDDDDIVRLLFIKQAKLCGFSLKEIARTIAIVEGSAGCEIDSDMIIDAKVDDIDRQIETLKEMKGMLLLYKDRVRKVDPCSLGQYLLQNK